MIALFYSNYYIQVSLLRLILVIYIQLGNHPFPLDFQIYFLWSYMSILTIFNLLCLWLKCILFHFGYLSFILWVFFKNHFLGLSKKESFLMYIFLPFPCFILLILSLVIIHCCFLVSLDLFCAYFPDSWERSLNSFNF